MTKTFTEALTEALVSHEYNDVTGTVAVNVTDGLFAIATAINRLATVQEMSMQAQADRLERAEQMMATLTRGGLVQ